MTTVTTKPADKQWWNEVNPDSATRYGNFCSSYPGVVSVQAGLSQTDPNKWESVIVFESQAKCQEFANACKTNTDFTARKTYLNANGFNVAFTFA